jgi:hypothetical protein
MKDDPLKICPQCGREIRRLINGGSGIIFKGSGFYVTDKAKGAAKAGGKTPAASPGKTADTAGGKAAGPDKAASAGENKSAPAAPAASAEKKAGGAA